MARIFRQIALTIAMMALTALVMVSASPAPAATVQASKSFFNTVEVKKTTLKMIMKWTDAISRYDAERVKNDGSCSSTELNKCHYTKWRAFIDELRADPPVDVLTTINRFLNPPNRRYVSLIPEVPVQRCCMSG